MIVQVISKFFYIYENYFSLHIPGGGVGDSDVGCKGEWGNNYNWTRTGYMESVEQCQELPPQIQSGY